MSDRYLLGDVLGGGRFTEVLDGIAESKHGHRRRVSFKRARAGWMKHPSFAKAFSAAAERAAKLRHGNIVRVSESGTIDGVACMVVERVVGLDLGAVLEHARDGRLENGVAAAIAARCCQALDYAHGEGVTHGELTLTNVLVSEKGQVKVADFGFAQAINSMPDAHDPNLAPVMWLDPRHQSPEWAMDGSVSPVADVFSLGLLLWRLLSGQRLHADVGDLGALTRLVKQDVPAPSATNIDVDDALDAVVMKALARDANGRYRSPAELGAALSDYLDASGASVADREIAALVEGHVAELAKPKRAVELVPFGTPAPVEKRDRDVLFSLRELQLIEEDAISEEDEARRRAEERRIRAQMEEERARREAEEAERMRAETDERGRLEEAERRARVEAQMRIEHERLSHEMELRRVESSSRPGLLSRMFGWMRRSKETASTPPLGAEPEVAAELPANARAAAAGADPVDCSVYAPPRAPAGETIMVQVMAHTPDQVERAGSLARAADEDAEWRATRSLAVDVPRGAALAFELSFPGRDDIESATELLTWRGDVSSVQFDVTVPRDARDKLVGKVLVSQDSVPVGSIRFTIKIGARDARAAEQLGTAQKFRYAFISYAAVDRDEVLRRVQMLETLKIQFFQDVLALDPGARWESELYRNIDQADVFFLFWSRAASSSEWVRKEIEYALNRKNGADENPPEILPIPIGSEQVAPPDQLSHLHFGGRISYFMHEGR